MGPLLRLHMMCVGASVGIDDLALRDFIAADRRGLSDLGNTVFDLAYDFWSSAVEPGNDLPNPLPRLVRFRDRHPWMLESVAGKDDWAHPEAFEYDADGDEVWIDGRLVRVEVDRRQVTAEVLSLDPPTPVGDGALGGRSG